MDTYEQSHSGLFVLVEVCVYSPQPRITDTSLPIMNLLDQHAIVVSAIESVLHPLYLVNYSYS